jgi:hypothetical protein
VEAICCRTLGDVSSPGLSSRVARYAEDSKTLTHQKQYSGPGQFPLVQLDPSASRLPVLSYNKLRRSVHIPVTVRIAPPQSSDARYTTWDNFTLLACLACFLSTRSTENYHTLGVSWVVETRNAV